MRLKSSNHQIKYKCIMLNEILSICVRYYVGIISSSFVYVAVTLNERHRISSHWQLDCLFNKLNNSNAERCYM